MLSGFRAKEGNDGGEFVRRLENEFEAFFGVKHAIALNSATAALHAALLACGIGEGDEVIVSPYSFTASASCVKMVGATPIFADIEDATFCIDPVEVEKAITSKTRAIIPVHLMGHPANMLELMFIALENDIKLIEDSAQALGAECCGRYTGTIGDCGVFSFNQSKPVSCGEGGMLITDDDYIARVVRAVRNHAEVSDPELGIIGYNYRMCEIEAAIVLEQFKKLDKLNNHRIMLTNYMSELLSDIEGLTPPVTYPDCKHVFYTYALKYDSKKMSRNEFQERCIEKGLYFGKDYVRPIYQLPAFGGLKGLCPVAEKIQKELMVTDIFRYPMKKDYVKLCYNIIRDVLQR